MTNYKKKKLLQIAEMLENHVDDSDLQFDMNVWLDTNLDDCGTACCAIGMGAYKNILPRKFKVATNSVSYCGKVGMEAVSKYFEIYLYEAYCLFGSSAYKLPTSKNVAERIRNFVETGNTQIPVAI